jgi:hypothetical protein
MSLSDRLSKVSAESNNIACKLGALLTGTQLTPKEKTQLEEILAVSVDDPTRVSHSALSVILREEGYDISKSSIDRHKRKACPCYRRIS